ncbi:MAG: NAD(P)-binding domain-containing protein, partial [Candidatus Bathyarchaeia archaeon]
MLDSITFIGGGVMAEAMIQGLLSKKIVNPTGITASEPRPERRRELNETHGVKVTADNRQA